MTNDEKLAYLMHLAQVAFCDECDKPIHMADANVAYYADANGHYQCIDCAGKTYLSE